MDVSRAVKRAEERWAKKKEKIEARKEPMVFGNMIFQLKAIDIAQYGESVAVRNEFEKNKWPIDKVPLNSIVIRDIVDEPNGIYAYRITWRLDGKPFKKKFLKQTLESIGFVPIKFIDLIKVN